MNDNTFMDVIVIIFVILALLGIIGFLDYRYPARACIVCGHSDYDGRMCSLNFRASGVVFVCPECAPIAMVTVIKCREAKTETEK